LLAALPLAGRTITGDALYCQRALCRQVRGAGGDYLVLVKDNQPTLLTDIRTLFDEPPPGEVFATTAQRDRGHGRCETRRLWASAALAGYLDWPEVGQVGKVERTVTARGRTTTETRYFVTSHGTGVGADHLLRMVRGHWQIEVV
jgi:predicted transposase YbfD/YdcC